MMQCFDDASTCRQSGMSTGPVPWNVVKDWAQHHGLDYPQTNRLWSVIRLVDAKVRSAKGA